MKTLLKVLSLLFAVQAFAGPCNDTGCCGEKRAECCVPAPGPFAFSYPKDIGLACPSDFYFFGEFLYMQAKEDSLDYAISYSPCEPQIPQFQFNFPITNGDIEGFSNDNHNWHWNPGFRIGMGFFLNHDAWTMEGIWTHVNITNHHTTSLNGNGVLIPLWVVGNPFRGTGEPVGSARWKADFNTFDIHVGKPHHISRYLIVSPHFGLRFAYIDQYYHVQYSGDFNNKDGADMSANNDFWGIGTRVGFDTEWMMGCGAGLYTNIAASILYGKFDVSQSWLGADALLTDLMNNNMQKDNYGNNGHNSSMKNDLEHEFYANATNFELQVGIFWGMYLCDMRYHVSTRLGWEFQYWWDQNNMRKWHDDVNPIYNDALSRGDLTLNGLVFRLQFDF